jgi:hypothetical protein
MGGWENSILFIRQPSVSLSLSLFLCFFGMSVSDLIHVASLIHFTSPMWLHGSLRNYLSPSISLQMDTVFSYISHVLNGFSVACGIGSLRNYPLPFIPLQRDVVFAYISLLLSGSAEACGIIRSPPFRCRRVSFSYTFYFSYVAPRYPAELSAPLYSAAEECRFLIHFTSPIWLRGSLRNYPLHPIPLQRGVVFSYILLLLCGSAVSCGIIRSTQFRCRGVSLSHTSYLSYVAPR